MIDLKADSQLAAGLNSPEASKGNRIQRIDSSFQRLNVQKMMCGGKIRSTAMDISQNQS